MKKNKRKNNLYFSPRNEKPKRHIDRRLIRNICIVAAVFVLAVTVAVLSGIALGKKANDIPTETESETQSIRPAKKPGHVEARNYSVSEAGEKAEAGQTVSVAVRNEEGDLLLNFETAHLLGISSDSTEINASRLVTAVHEKGAGLSVLFWCHSFKSQNDTIRKNLTDIEKMLIGEILDAGPDELVLCGLPSDADGMVQFSSFLEDIVHISGETSIGVACPYSSVAEQGSDILKLYNEADFLLLDLHGCSGPEEEYVDDGNGNFVLVPNENSALFIYKEYYDTIVSCDMRILLDGIMVEELESLTEAGCGNWQLTDVHG